MNRIKHQGVRASNQDFARFEQVAKSQHYGLSEAPGDAFDDRFQIQVCDMRDWLADPHPDQPFVQQLGRALEDIGFAILVGHGVDPELYRRAEHWVREFFESIPEEQRRPFRAQRFGSVNQGYFPIEETTVIHPDMVEGWVFCRRAFDLGDDDPGAGNFRAEDFWPSPQFEPRFRQLVQAHERLIVPVMRALLSYLGCPINHYDRRLTGTNFGFRLNYYPVVENAPGGRMLGHEDVDLFTLLPAPSIPGLQVLNRRNMRWIRLDPPPGSIILNTGDYMQRISNDRLPSTTHRVAQPAEPQLAPRVSFPMAVYVWEDEILEVLPGLESPHYPPIRAETFHTRITSKYYGDAYAEGVSDASDG